MRGSVDLFNTYQHSLSKATVRVVDGSLDPIHGQGLVNCIATLTLSFVLHVPSFTTNLLSAQRLTESLQCSVIYFPSHCIFQDLATGHMISSGKAQDGIYILENEPLS